jgi:RNA polymerase sigma-70 factor (ECF subfamily)
MASISLTLGTAQLSSTNLNQFLASSERRAYRIALAAVGDPEEALDIVQDSMLKLARLYAHKPEPELRILFNRILQSRIRDWYRRQRVRKAVMGWLPGNLNPEEESEEAFSQVPQPGTHNPQHLLENDELVLQIETAVRALPKRQREAFFLRCWDGLSTRDTAKAMKISEGSVKTHYSRALKALRDVLESQL